MVISAECLCKVEIDELAHGSGNFSHCYGPGELRLDEPHVRLLASVDVAGGVHQKGGEFRLEGKITAASELECDRCLKPLAFPVDVTFDVTYIRLNDYPGPGIGELNEVDLKQSAFCSNSIDVDELVREQILLTLPNRVLCGVDCKGLCADCGADKNLNDCGCEHIIFDPRWAALKGLQL